MKVRWLGWAGVEIEADGAAVVIDPLADPGATFAALGDRAREVELPAVVAPEAKGTALAGLVSHLHRDHTDAGALAAALADDATVHEPAWPGGATSRTSRWLRPTLSWSRRDCAERRAGSGRASKSGRSP